MKSNPKHIIPFLFFLALSGTVFAQDSSHLIVEGRGEVQVEPDTAFVTLGVNRRATIAKEAQGLVNEALNDPVDG